MNHPKASYVLITGGAGFIGTNLAHRLASEGKTVLIYDNLSRKGVENNLTWLLNTHPQKVAFWKADIRDAERVKAAVQGAEAVYHLAAQVAVTSSLEDPLHDFEVNAKGTLNLLEALRGLKKSPPLFYTSTNKVLGGLENVELRELETRYEPVDSKIKDNGIGEDWGIEFCSPYGCSKGAADQYVLDYARNYQIPAVVFRMSCIYGPHQRGNEDQGWVAHFVKQSLEKQTIVFYGDGKQVRDALYADDLIDAFLSAERNIEKAKGQAFNIGGGAKNTTSLIELVQWIGSISGQLPEVKKEPWRPSDQRYYVSNVNTFQTLTGWTPQVDFKTGIQKLYAWMKQFGYPS